MKMNSVKNVSALIGLITGFLFLGVLLALQVRGRIESDFHTLVATIGPLPYLLRETAFGLARKDYDPADSSRWSLTRGVASFSLPVLCLDVLMTLTLAYICGRFSYLLSYKLLAPASTGNAVTHDPVSSRRKRRRSPN
jgi:hypothetical protein